MHLLRSTKNLFSGIDIWGKLLLVTQKRFPQSPFRKGGNCAKIKFQMEFYLRARDLFQKGESLKKPIF
ncbi:MAG: hypothetical protein A2007_00015 [Verrucomicrobia bacterium GWC2_42_7]|nr:MAG: hypothetical protein A2007_00015 [Verrucomicrobia bacterium GWC2_42_7]